MFDCYRIYKKHYNNDNEMYYYYIFVTTNNRLAFKYNDVTTKINYVNIDRINDVTIEDCCVQYIKIHCDTNVYNRFISIPFIQKLIQFEQDKPIYINPDFLSSRYEFFQNSTKDKIIITHNDRHLCVYELYQQYDSTEFDVDLKPNIQHIEKDPNVILFNSNYYLKIYPSDEIYKIITEYQHPLMQLDI